MKRSDCESKWRLDVVNGVPLVPLPEANLRTAVCVEVRATLSILLLESCLFLCLPGLEFLLSQFHLSLALIHSLQLGGISNTWGVRSQKVFWLGRKRFQRPCNILIRIKVKSCS